MLTSNPENAPDHLDPADQLVNSATMKAMFGGVSDMWVSRRRADDPYFPEPIRIANRNFWRLADLRAYVAKKAETVEAQ